MILPDNVFFELLRTVLGKIKTPYNKQVLMNDLEKFLLRDDIIKNIAAYIDHDDSLVIAAIAALNEPAPEDLEAFFDGDLSYTELHNIIVNLEERFIVYRHKNHLALNPALKSILSPIAADSSMLFPSIAANEAVSANETADDTPVSKAILDDRILAALLSFVSRNKVFLRTGGIIRQKVSNAANTLFPGLPLQTIIGSLQVLGLFFAEDETLVPDYNRFAGLGNLTRQERLAYCAASILCNANFQKSAPFTNISPWQTRAKAHHYAQLIINVYNSMSVERQYPNTTLQKLTYIMERANIDLKNTENKVEYSSDEIIDAMEKTGLIIPVSDNSGSETPVWRKAPPAESSTEGVPIVFDTTFTFLVYPEIAYNDAIKLAAFSDVIEAGTTVRFELSRDSVAQAYNRDLSADIIIELLQRLSHNRTSENLIFTLRDWEKLHREVTLRRGVVLTLSPQQRHLAETRSLERLIVETLAPGIYMLPESAEEKAIHALNMAGVAIIARGDQRGDKDSIGGESSSGLLNHFFLHLHADKSPVIKTPPASAGSDRSAPVLIENFHSILNQMQLGGETRDELAARINRRLVLCEAQLKEAVVRYEKLEARGMDYVGKTLIAKQAISMQLPVEVVWPGKQKQERAFGIPKALEKTDGDSVLIVELSDGGGAIRVPLGKISLLRRVKKSIFEG